MVCPRNTRNNAYIMAQINKPIDSNEAYVCIIWQCTNQQTNNATMLKSDCELFHLWTPGWFIRVQAVLSIYFMILVTLQLTISINGIWQLGSVTPCILQFLYFHPADLLPPHLHVLFNKFQLWTALMLWRWILMRYQDSGPTPVKHKASKRRTQHIFRYLDKIGWHIPPVLETLHFRPILNYAFPLHYCLTLDPMHHSLFFLLTLDQIP